LADGTKVIVTPLAVSPGSPAAVLEAAALAPQVPAAWVDELDRLIAEGQRPPAAPELFNRQVGDPEST
jgi:hypothetical protein